VVLEKRGKEKEKKRKECNIIQSKTRDTINTISKGTTVF
jgi:hypothetical protein